MCTIILAPNGEVPAENRWEAAHSNPDGFGFSYINNKGVAVTRKALKYEHAHATYERVERSLKGVSPMLLHFRIATHGDVCIANTHPFDLKNGGVMAHNGVLHTAGLPTGESDTRYFIDNVVNQLPDDWYKTAHWPDVLEDAMTGSKMAAIFPDRSYLILKERLGVWRDEVWYSNYNAFPKTFTATAASSTSQAWQHENMLEGFVPEGYNAFPKKTYLTAAAKDSTPKPLVVEKGYNAHNNGAYNWDKNGPDGFLGLLMEHSCQEMACYNYAQSHQTEDDVVEDAFFKHVQEQFYELFGASEESDKDWANFVSLIESGEVDLDDEDDMDFWLPTKVGAKFTTLEPHIDLPDNSLADDDLDADAWWAKHYKDYFPALTAEEAGAEAALDDSQTEANGRTMDSFALAARLFSRS